MTRRMIRRAPIENEIELALSPGGIRDRACFSFVSSLEAVASQIDTLLKTDSARAAGLCEILLAGCREKAEELDDSGGSFGRFAQAGFRPPVRFDRLATNSGLSFAEA
jgi:hypothetical protein